MSVILVRWPEDAAEADRLSTEHVPHLLLVGPRAEPPPADRADLCEDWIRLPADEQDLEVRLATLEGRAAWWHPEPALGDDLRLLFQGHWVALSEIEHDMMIPMVERYNELVTMNELANTWSGPRPAIETIRVHLHRLRRRIDTLGLEIVTITGRGVVLSEKGLRRTQYQSGSHIGADRSNPRLRGREEPIG